MSSHLPPPPCEGDGPYIAVNTIGMRELYERAGGDEEERQRMTTAEVCERVVKPMTRGGGGPEGTGQSYVELVGRREEEGDDEEGSEVVHVVGDPPDGRGALIVGGVRHRRGRRWGGIEENLGEHPP